MRETTADRLTRETEAARDLLAQLGEDDEAVNHDLIEGETSLIEAVEAALREMDECDLLVTGINHMLETYKARKTRVEARKDRIRALVEQAMLRTEVTQFKLPGATLSIKRVPPKVVVTDEAAIPAEFWKMEPKLDRSALGAAAKDQQIPGVEMSNGSVALQVRRK